MNDPKSRTSEPAASPSSRPRNTGHIPIETWAWALAAAWTLFIVLALWWNTAHIDETVHNLATITARTYFGRIASLNPVRPGDAPDAWERKALEAFERGETEVIAVEPMGGEPHLRLMRPMRVEASCLKCHASNGYKEGEMRGGISVALPMKDYEAIVLPHQREEMFAHGVIWIFGLALLGVGDRQFRHRWREQASAQASLRESEARLNKAEEIAHVGSWEFDLLAGRLSWSEEVYRIFGLPSHSTITYEAFLDAVHPDDRAAVETAYSGSVREGRDTYEIGHRIVRKSTGEIRDVREKCQHVRDASGKIIRSIGMVHDITEGKRMEEARQRQADELRARNEELTRFNRAATDRELRMIELKRENNELRRKAGEPPRYPLEFSDPAPKG